MERTRTMGINDITGRRSANEISDLIKLILISINYLRSIIPAGDKQAQKMIAGIELSAVQVDELVKKVMSNKSRLSEERQTIYLDEIVRDIYSFLSNTFPRNIVIDTDISSEVLPITGSTLDIYKAIVNVCLNARDAMPEGGGLSLSVKNETLIQKEQQFAHRYVCLRVADTGGGISQEELSRDFEPYYSRTRKGKGTELGLFYVRNIVELHGGFITVKSIPDNGTVFNLYFPTTIHFKHQTTS